MSPSRLGTVWAGHRIDAEIGARGAVHWYSGHDPEGRPVVLQVVLDTDAGDDVHERMVADARMAAVIDHPHLLPVLDVVRTDGATVIVTADVGGPDLRSELNLSPLTLAGCEAVATQIGAALDRLHAAGLVHADVSPVHVQRDADSGTLLLGGVGCHHALSSVHEPVLRHVAPEQLRGEPAGPAADIYGLGCTLFECLTGRVPFPAGSIDEIARRHLEREPPSVSRFRPDRPSGIDGVVARALAKDPAERHRSGAALADALVDARYSSPSFETGVIRNVGPSAPMGTGGVGGSSEPGTSPLPISEEWIEEWGPDWDDDEPSRAARALVAVMAILVVVVGLLVWRAVNTDATLDVAVATPTTSSAPRVASPSVPPTLERAQELVPRGIEACAPAADQPTDEPLRVVLQCPNQSVPELLTLTLFADLDARDQAFDDAIALLASPVAGEECALGRHAEHDYIGVSQVGRVACRQDGTRVDFVWTTSESPLLLWAGGQGTFPDHYGFWASSVDRVDAAFPVPEEQTLLSRLPQELVIGCRRELALADAAGAELAVTCTPDGVIPESVSWLAFGSADAMDRWIEDRPPAPPEPRPVGVAGTCPEDGIVAYALGGTTGRVACTVDGREIRLTWTRSGELLGSVASADATPVRTVDAMVAWWREGGHRP